MNIRFFLILLGITTLLFSIFFGVSAYGYYRAIHADDPIDPMLMMEVGNGKIIRDDTAILLSQEESYTLEEDDIVETEKGGYGTITWPDKSITRLGTDTRIIIRKMRVSQNYDTIQVSYDMKRGKVWNTVIRVLLGDSYFEARLPKDDIIAGVRGTVFEVNLDAGYIHAVEHSTKLSDASGKILHLLPGELVSSENIWVRKGREWLDSTWEDWNTVRDASYKNLRDIEIQTYISSFQENPLFSLIGNIHHRFSDTNMVDIRAITDALQKQSIDTLKSFDTTHLLAYYQSLGGGRDDTSRDIIRRAIIEQPDTTENTQNIKTLFTEISLWESISTGNILPSLRDSLGVDDRALATYKNILLQGADIKTISTSLKDQIQSLLKN